MKRTSIPLLAVGLTVGAALVACGDDDTAPANTSSSSGGSSSSSSSSSSGGAALSLYARLGGKTGLEQFTEKVVNEKILTDADLKTFFFNQVAAPIPAKHPSAKQIVVCFGRFVGAALKEDTYPGEPVNDPANAATPDFMCRSMVLSHKGADTQLNIGDGNFDKFVGHIATSLQPLIKPEATMAGEITQAEFDALAAALNGTKADVTTPGAPSTGPFVKP